jgi:hypothetical protein
MSDVPNTRGQLLVDVRLTLAILVTICLEAVAGLLWIGAAAERLSALETNMAAQQSITERIARIEAQMTGVRATLDRIENRMDKDPRP